MSAKIDTGTDELLCSIDQRVGIITLNKPKKKNALGDILTPALRQTLLTLESDPRVGCVMITGSGDAFCSGGDIGGMGSRNDEPSASALVKSSEQRIDELTQKQITLSQRIHELSKPTVAALPGAAAGAGLSIALACDLRIASENAFVTTAFRNIGLSGDYGASWFLPRLIGLGRAKEIFFSGRRVSAQECLDLGIVNQVYAHEDFRESALDYALQLANGPTAALARMKMNLNLGMDQSLESSLALEAKHTIESFACAESTEAIRAFMEKRQAKFHD